MIRWSVFVLLFAFSSCKYFVEEEPIRIVSDIDGEAYFEDMDGEMNARKGARMIIQGQYDSVSYIFVREISDSLNTKDSVWRDRYFTALNKIITEQDSADMAYIAENTFAYFLHFPEEFLDRLNSTAFDHSDYWSGMIAHEYQIKTAPDDITINSVINRAHRSCEECSEETMLLIQQYVEFVDSMEETLLYSEEGIGKVIL